MKAYKNKNNLNNNLSNFTTVLKKLQGTSFKVMQLTKLMTFMIIANKSSERGRGLATQFCSRSKAGQDRHRGKHKFLNYWAIHSMRLHNKILKRHRNRGGKKNGI